MANGPYTRESWIIVVLVLAVVAIALFATGARGHEWYPKECCSGQDCAPVEKAEFINPIEATGLPTLVVTTKHGTAIVPKNFIWRQSEDNQLHACMNLYDKNPATRLICIFGPPTN